MNLIEKREALMGASHHRTASLHTPVSTGSENTLSFVFISEDNGGMRYDWMSGESYEEVLDVAGANYDSLTTFFKDHDRSVNSAIGRIENVRVENGELMGDVVFGSGTDEQDIYRKYAEGILTDVSIGYRINGYEVEERADAPDLVTVTGYDIFEVSAVGIGFDAGAKVSRSSETTQSNTRSDKMTIDELKERVSTLEKVAERSEEQEAEFARVKSELDAEMVRMREENAELKRQAEIRDICDKYDADDELRSSLLADTAKTAKDAMQAILDKRAGSTPSAPVKVGETPNRKAMLKELADVVSAKMGVRDVDLASNTFAGASLIDVSRMVTGMTGMQYGKEKIVDRAMVTSDFPALLLESGNRKLEQEFDSQPLTYKQWVKEQDLPDFRENKDIVRGSAGGRLDKITENGELKEKQLSEAAETWALESFGNQFIITREMMINDDLSAFTGMLEEFAILSGNTANGRVYDLLRKTGDFSTYTMADGYAIFDATNHGNFGNTPFNSQALSDARVAMRKQQDLGGAYLNIAPQYLIVAPELEQEALMLLNSRASTEDGKNNQVYNPHYKSLQLIVDAELATPDEWYLAAGRRTIKAGYLAGTGRRPQLKTDVTSLTRTVFEGIFDFGVMAEDYRGLYKGK